MRVDTRVAEAERLLPIYRRAIADLESFLRLVETGNIKPQEVERGGHVAVRFVEKTPEEALFLKLGRLVSLNKVLIILVINDLFRNKGSFRGALTRRMRIFFS